MRLRYIQSTLIYLVTRQNPKVRRPIPTNHRILVVAAPILILGRVTNGALRAGPLAASHRRLVLVLHATARRLLIDLDLVQVDRQLAVAFINYSAPVVLR